MIMQVLCITSSDSAEKWTAGKPSPSSTLRGRRRGRGTSSPAAGDENSPSAPSRGGGVNSRGAFPPGSVQKRRPRRARKSISAIRPPFESPRRGTSIAGIIAAVSSPGGSRRRIEATRQLPEPRRREEQRQLACRLAETSVSLDQADASKERHLRSGAREKKASL